MQLVVGGASDTGLMREENQDCYRIVPEHHLFLVADGMGGHRGGEIASKMAAEKITEFFVQGLDEDKTWPLDFDPDRSMSENRLVTGIRLANDAIYKKSNRDWRVRGMGTTVVSVCYSPEDSRLFVAHVGDSRAYRVRDGKITLLTRDHSLVNELLGSISDLTPEQRAMLPTNVITRALGVSDDVLVDVTPERPETGDRYVLCSDGLTNMVSDEEIRQIVVSSGLDLNRAARQLVDLANHHGGEDNITVVVVGFETR